jgi:type I restriction enzyme S subunit
VSEPSYNGNVNLRRFKPYPSYKDSGVEWLGEMPAHWEVRRLKLVAPSRMSKLDSKPDNALYVGLENVESWTGRLLLDNQPESVDSIVASFNPGDVLFGKLRPYLAKVARPDFAGVCTSEILPLRPGTKCSQSYVMYCLLNAPYIRWLDSLTYGTRMPRVSPEQVGCSFVPVPPELEQRAIADFLDRDTAKIDALVAKKERLIELLREKRTALITRAVTKGLDSGVPMKDSGVEWLGEIPAHWETQRNKWLFREVNERSKAGDEELLTVSHMTGVTPRSEKEVYMFMAESLQDYKVCHPGDLAINTMWAWLGALGIAPVHGVVSPSYNVYRLRQYRRLLPKYLDYLYRTPSHITEIARYSNRVWTSRLRLYPEEFFLMQTLIPPYAEQLTIVDFLDQESFRIDSLVAKIQDGIGRLKEYRTALISAAVTGKIDVRDSRHSGESRNPETVQRAGHGPVSGPG